MLPVEPQFAPTPHGHPQRLGVLLGGLGAISTTLIAGIEAIKRGLAQPVGSLAQLGMIDVETATGSRQLRIRDYLELPGPDDLDCLVFGAWDVVQTDAY